MGVVRIKLSLLSLAVGTYWAISPVPTFFETESLPRTYDLLVRLGCSLLVPRILLSAPLQCWNYKHGLLLPSFYCWCWVFNSGKSLPTELFSQQPPSFWDRVPLNILAASAPLYWDLGPVPPSLATCLFFEIQFHVAHADLEFLLLQQPLLPEY